MTTESSYRIEIAPQGWSFDCPPEQTLLLGALAAGFKLPNSCRNGTCRTCITKLVAGRIEHRIKWPGLSFDEKKEGWILPCVACPHEDLTIEAPMAVETNRDNALMPSQPPPTSIPEPQ